MKLQFAGGRWTKRDKKAALKAAKRGKLKQWQQAQGDVWLFVSGYYRTIIIYR